MGTKSADGGSCRSASSTEALVRKLVAQIAPAAKDTPARPSKKNGAPDGDDVLFTGEVVGVRCLLVRTHAAPAASISLSPREQEIARMIAKGYANKTIAAVLDISVWTVSTHLRRIFAKLGVTSRAAMVTKMLTHGML